MPPNALQVGVTGGIGSGKTFLCKIFEVLGIAVYYADQRAKWLQNNHADLVTQIKSAFGENTYKSNGCLDRIFLAREVFSNPKKLALLNQLVHPKVNQDYKQWVQQRLSAPYTLKEAALLYESGSYQQLDCIINVDASKDTRLRRVLARDKHRTEEQVNAIMEKQFSDEERRRLANFTIDNNEGILVVPQVLYIHQTLLKKANGN
ncbi:MAG: dephospho-CoA kinase [Cyclobacteriaceae bacterium]